MKITLIRYGVTKGVIDWDNGVVTGDDPSLVKPILDAVEDALNEGGVSGEPLHTSYPLTLPLNDLGQFAALLHSMRYSLDGELLAAFNQYRESLSKVPPKFTFEALGINKLQVIY